MMNYILATEKKWHDTLFNSLKKTENGNWYRIADKESFTYENLSKIKPEFVFIPHWSHIIPAKVYENFNCIVFHMTDLPYGRGGSPLQNLIVRGHKETVISAIKVSEGIDTGPVYLKKPLSLEGTAEEIFIRSASVIEIMIREIIEQKPIAKEQQGQPTVFKRRKAEDGNLAQLTELQQVYDYIRMLDCEGYPNAFLETENFKFEFTKASVTENESLTAHVRITKK